jgi:hypothetical protein
MNPGGLVIVSLLNRNSNRREDVDTVAEQNVVVSSWIGWGCGVQTRREHIGKDIV